MSQVVERPVYVSESQGIEPQQALAARSNDGHRKRAQALLELFGAAEQPHDLLIGMDCVRRFTRTIEISERALRLLCLLEVMGEGCVVLLGLLPGSELTLQV